MIQHPANIKRASPAAGKHVRVRYNEVANALMRCWHCMPACDNANPADATGGYL
jgi:hypothetical protein